MLSLDFSLDRGRVRISSDQDYAEALQNLRWQFPSAHTLSTLSFEIEIDDLLVNLVSLASWPAADSDVRWQSDLLALVETNASDAQVVANRLASGPTDTEQTLNLSPEWSAPLTDFQQRDFAYLSALSHGANFSVPGAGKTRVALALFDSRRARGDVSRMLVVCPKSAYQSWLDESRIALPGETRLAIMDSRTPPPGDLILVNYERLPDARPSLITWLSSAPALLVLDEAHRMKLGAAGAWGSACLALGPYARQRLILSGTPAPNGVRDLENLMSFVWPGQGRSAVASAVSSGDLRTASRQLRPLFARTTKSELGLPPLDISLRRVELPPLHRELYNALVGQAASRWTDTRDVEALGRILLYLIMAATTPALLALGGSRYEPLPYRVPPLSPPPDSTLSTLMRELPHYELSPKYAETLRIVANNAARGRKTLVWSTFVRNLTSLGSLLSNYEPAIVHGGSPDREEEIQRFKSDPSCMVLLSNPATLGEGVSLHHSCHEAVYVDRDFAAGRFLQSVDRIHRLGLSQDEVTNITVLVSNDTIDEVIERRLASKLSFMGGILNDPEVLALGDLEEELTSSIGMDGDDLVALRAMIRGVTN